MISLNKFKNKKILITGHTGFKGAWLSYIFYLNKSKVYGISDKILPGHSFFKALKLKDKINSYYIDLNNYDLLKKKINEIKPDIIFHLAAEAIVSRAYDDPLNTFKINILGTANILNILNNFNHKCTGIFITSDKCYENIEIKKSYRETDRLGGSDPYSASKASAEILISSMYRSYLVNKKNIKIGICRAGNVIGGGDWSENRLIPDVIRSIISKKKLIIRNPRSTRPWQHVLDPLNGYITLSYLLHFKKFKNGHAFNFGPKPNSKYDVKKVLEIINSITIINYRILSKPKMKEANLLSLNSNKAFKFLGWRCRYDIKTSIKMTINWYLYYIKNSHKIEKFTQDQIKKYFN